MPQGMPLKRRAGIQSSKRCESRFQRRDGKIVRCSNRLDHDTTRMKHQNETPGKEVFWTDEEAYRG